MKNKTIKTFTPITVEQALKLASDGEHLCFTQNEGEGRKFWTEPSKLESIHPNRRETYKLYRDGSYKYCATATELDPNQAPDGCPELEPWMAYVGHGEFDGSVIPTAEVCVYFVNQLGDWELWTSPRSDGARLFAIDVSKAWSQEHFPEHCRIRAYEEPEPIDDTARLDAIFKIIHEFGTSGLEKKFVWGLGRVLDRDAIDAAMKGAKS